MSVPKSRKSSSSVRRRRSHLHLNPINIGTCEKCKAPALSHQACRECGFYKGRQSVDLTRDAQRAIAKQQQASAPAHDHSDHDHGKEEAESTPDTEKKSAE